MKLIRIAGAAFALMMMCGTSQSAEIGQPDLFRVRQAFDVEAPYAPSVSVIGRERRLVYELHLTSFSRGPLTLTAIAAIDRASGRTLARLEGAALAAAVDGVGTTIDKLSVEPGRRAIVYLDLLLSGPPPVSLVHRVEFDAPGLTSPERAAVIGGRTEVRNETLPILGPPLRGGPWVAVYDPALENGHRRYVYAVGGRARVPGRHAIDWMRPSLPQDAEGKNNRGAGAEVLAVANGVIAATKDGVPEPAQDVSRPPMRLGDATGNYVAIDIGGGRYAFYEHLMPGLRVKPGDRIRRGQAIGRLGSTGQASRPHLHFHLSDSKSPLGAEGIPYRLQGARIIGAYPSIPAFEKGGSWQPAENPSSPALPTPNAVVMFPD